MPPDPDPDPDPCFDCRCCRAWTRHLEILRDAIKAHVATEVRVARCDPECLVCATVDWQG